MSCLFFRFNGNLQRYAWILTDIFEITHPSNKFQMNMLDFVKRRSCITCPLVSIWLGASSFLLIQKDLHIAAFVNIATCANTAAFITLNMLSTLTSPKLRHLWTLSMSKNNEVQYKNSCLFLNVLDCLYLCARRVRVARVMKYTKHQQIKCMQYMNPFAFGHSKKSKWMPHSPRKNPVVQALLGEQKEAVARRCDARPPPFVPLSLCGAHDLLSGSFTSVHAYLLFLFCGFYCFLFLSDDRSRVLYNI